MQCNSGIQTKNPDILLLNHKISPNESEFHLCQVAQQDELRRGLAAAKEEAARAEADLVEARREIEVRPRLKSFRPTVSNETQVYSGA